MLEMMPRMRPAWVKPSPVRSMRPARIAAKSLFPITQATGPKKPQTTRLRIRKVKTMAPRCSI